MPALDWIPLDRWEPLTSLIDPTVPVELSDPLASIVDVSNQLNLIRAALALLRENDDLLRWSTCLVEDARAADARFATSQNVETCVMNALGGDWTIYLISRFLRPIRRRDITDSNFNPPIPRSAPSLTVDLDQPTEHIRTASATGGATNLLVRLDEAFSDALDRGEARSGAVLPINHSAWRNVSRIFADPSQSIGNRIGAMAWAADIIVHEWMHLCIGDLEAGLEDDFTCFPLQTMVSRAFNWALGQRYKCINGSCFETSDYSFMYMAESVKAEGIDFRLLRLNVEGALDGSC